MRPCEYPSQWGDKHWTHRMPERVARGERHYAARLTVVDVLTMRRAYARKELTVREIAAKWGIDPKHAHDVVTGRKWSHVPGAVQARRYRRAA